MTGLAWVVGLTVIFVVNCVAAKRDAKRRMSTLAELADKFGGDVISSDAIHGHRQGVSVTVSFATRGQGSDCRPWTEISTRLPPGYPLALHIRPRRSTDWLRKGTIDLPIGDPAFDVAFLVEAAPRDVVRQLIDEPARTMLRSYRAELKAIDDGRGGRLLQLAVPRWLEHAMPLAELVDELIRVTRRIRLAYATDEQIQPTTGSPYRPQVAHEQDRLAEREREVADVIAIATRRAALERRVGRLILAGFVSWGVLIAILHHVL